MRDGSTKDPLIGANVFILGTSLGGASNNDGIYTIPNVGLGTFTIKVSYIGYQSKELEIVIESLKIYTQDFDLDYVTIEGKVVEVTAQAKGQMDAINKQLKAKSIVNIVSSDRIQELPDANAAESVARIPGVSIRREGGEGNKVVIRGLSPKYNKITVNGTNLASTDPDDRSTDLSMISQYMLDGIEVTKAGTPDQEADVLGGTVNFILKKAQPGLHGNLVSQGMYNGLKKTQDDYKLVLDISNRFLNDRIGVLGQIDFENRNRSSHDLGAFYQNAPADLDSINPLQLTNLNLTDISRLNERQNSLFVLDINIPNGNISYSGLNSAIHKDQKSYSNVYPVTSEDRTYNTGQVYNDIKVITETWKYEQSLTPNLKIDAFTSFSLSSNGDTSKVFQFQERYAYTQLLNKVSVDSVQRFTVNDTDYTFFNRYDYNESKSRETERSYGGNLEYGFKLTNQLSGKLKLGFKSRKKSRSHDRDYEYAHYNYVAVPHVRDSTVNYFDWIDRDEHVFGLAGFVRYAAFMDPSYDDEGYLNGKYTLGPFADLDKMNEIFRYFRKNWNYADYHEYIMHHFHRTESLIWDYSGTEDYNASYIMSDLNIGSKLNMVTGLRFEKNETTYSSFHGMQSTLAHYNAAGSDSVFVYTRTNSYSLPSLFLRYEPRDWLVLRYAKTNTLTRPNYSDIIPLYHVLGISNAVIYRNPYLAPGLSENTDYVISVNNSHLGLLSFSYFTKEIDGLIYSSGRRYITDPDLYGLPHYTEKFQITDYRSNNPYKVQLEGFEIDYQTRFWYLPNLLRGLVFNANYTRTASQVKYPRTEIEFNIVFEPSFQVVTSNVDSFYVDRLIDQPKEIVNLSLGYDYKGFSGRLSMLQMSNVFKTSPFWVEMRESTDAYRRFDLSMKQKLPIKGLELYLNVSNLTEAVDVNRLRGFNPSDRKFIDYIDKNYNDISEFYSLIRETETDQLGNEVPKYTPEDILDMVPRDARAKSLEQHYGKTIDIGFRYSF